MARRVLPVEEIGVALAVVVARGGRRTAVLARSDARVLEKGRLLLQKGRFVVGVTLLGVVGRFRARWLVEVVGARVEDIGLGFGLVVVGVLVVVGLVLVFLGAVVLFVGVVGSNPLLLPLRLVIALVRILLLATSAPRILPSRPLPLPGPLLLPRPLPPLFLDLRISLQPRQIHAGVHNPLVVQNRM